LLMPLRRKVCPIACCFDAQLLLLRHEGEASLSCTCLATLAFLSKDYKCLAIQEITREVMSCQ